jgi:hypothetical protein
MPGRRRGGGLGGRGGGGELAVGQRPQVAERVHDGVAAEAELPLDLEGQIHAVEAVEADGVEPGVGPQFVGGEFAFEVRGQQVVHLPNRLRGERGRIDGLRGGRRAEVALPRPKQPVIADELRRLAAVGVVPRLEERVESLA